MSEDRQATGWLKPWLESDDGWPALARYASVSCLPPSLQPSGSETCPLDALTSALGRVREKDLWYVSPPWWAGQGQIVRDPDTILHTKGGTCLDVALLVVTMLLRHGEQPGCQSLRPLLAVGTHLGGSRHAFVLLTDETFIAHQHNRITAERFSDLAESVVAADPTSVLRATAESLPPEAVDTALQTGSELLGPHVFTHLDVIDIKEAQRQHAPLSPRETRPLAVYEMLPPIPPGRRLETWQAAIGDLAGTTVIVGESGMGKSAAALAAANRAEHAAGWFLDATTAATLQRALATAEVRSDPRLSAITVSGGEHPERLSSSALKRLREAPQSWIVIVDGANMDPQDYRHLLPVPDPARGQAVIVSSTNPAWLAWHAESGPTNTLPVPEGAPNQLLLRLGGSPGAPIAEAVTSAINGVSPDVSARLAAVAWLPPNSIEAFLDESGRPALAPHEVVELQSSGLVDESTGVIHSQIRLHLRHNHGLDWNFLHSLLAANGPLVGAFADASYYRALFDRLGDAPDKETRTSVRTLLQATISRDDVALADTMAAQVLDDLNWKEGSDFDGDQEQRNLVASCLESLSRTAIRNTDFASKARGVALTEVGHDLTNDVSRRSRLRALGLVGQRALAGDDVDRLRDLLTAFEDVYHERTPRLAAGHPDIDKALFNLPGTRVRLSKLVPEPERSHLLLKALEEYEQVLSMRERYLGDADTDDLASCHNGIGLCQYQMAAQAHQVLNDQGRWTDATRLDRIALLARASQSVALALRIRCQWAALRTVEAKTSTKLLVKISALQAHLLKESHRDLIQSMQWEYLFESTTHE